MKLVIFGSSGSVGREVVEQALQQEHTVTAFTRNPAKLDIKNPNLKIFQGDVLEFSAVEQAIQGQDAVICTLGSGQKLTGTVRSEGTRQIIKPAFLTQNAIAINKTLTRYRFEPDVDSCCQGTVCG